MRGKQAKQLRKTAKHLSKDVPWVLYEESIVTNTKTFTKQKLVRLGQCGRKMYQTIKNYYKQK